MPEFDLDAALSIPTDWWDALRLAEQKANTTCFCPGGGGDWKPLVKLVHVCDTFVYPDLCADGETSAASLRDFFEGISNERGLGNELRCVDARELSLGSEFCHMEAAMCEFIEEHCPAGTAAYREAVQPLVDKERWGVEAKLLHVANQVAREIRVLFFQAEALACYRGVYSARQLAPHAVVLPPQGGRRTLRSQQLSLDGPLGTVLRAEPRPALMLAGQEDVGTLAGTPWPHRWRELGEWNRAVFTPWPLPTHWWHDARQVRA